MDPSPSGINDVYFVFTANESNSGEDVAMTDVDASNQDQQPSGFCAYHSLLQLPESVTL